MSLESCTPSFLSLPTELIILLLSYLPAVELCAFQRTCHRIRCIVAESAHLQYILQAQINGVDDLLPPERPFSERLELLRCHEKSWSNLQLRVWHEFTAAIHQRHFLQDGYLIYNRIAGTLQYGYVDLLSSSPDEELRWVHISRDDICFPLCVVFAVDHNLAVVLRYIPGPFLTPFWMKYLNYRRLQDTARLACQPYVSRVHNRRATSAFVQTHRGASPKSRPRRSLRISGDPGRSCADDGDVWAGCVLLLPRLVEIGRGDPCES